MRFLVVAQHPPDLCPSSNGKVREIAKQSGQELPSLAKKHGVKVTDNFVTQTSHHVFIVAEADDIESVRQLTIDGRLGQWNTVTIYPVNTLEEALATTDDLSPIF
jgi:uncharacterized protein with GYD domain